MPYLDYAASTPLKKAVLETMLPYMSHHYGNASSIHNYGRQMNKAVDKSRRALSKLMGASYDELYFTSGGTEADNWALKGIMTRHKSGHLIVSAIEHPAVLNSAKTLEKEGYEVTYLAPNHQGLISLSSIEDAIKDNTILVSIMYVNNEIGTIQDIGSIGALCKAKGVLFHTDAVQAFGYLNINVKELNIDLMSISSHKIYGPTGIGGLYIRKGVQIKSLIDGGAQERKRRAGTHHVAGIVGFSKAAELRYTDLDELNQQLLNKRNYLLEGLRPLGIEVNGSLDQRHPGSINIMFHDVKGDSLLMNLDLAGIAVSAGSACSSGSVNPSHVLLSIGLSKVQAKASLRMSVGDFTSYEELDQVINEMTKIINRLK